MSKLILLRHGQSMWNLKNVFTGWVDVPLSEKGIEEAMNAGNRMAYIKFNAIFCSVQIRAIQTALLAMSRNNGGKVPVVVHEDGKMSEWGKIYSGETEKDTIPVYTDWHLNERYYGELQGLNKAATAEKYGSEQVHLWRRSYIVPPPNGECLKDTADRTLPFFRDYIKPLLERGDNILVSAHGNSLRSIVMELDSLSEEEVLKLEIPTGKPLSYEFKNGTFTKQGYLE